MVRDWRTRLMGEFSTQVELCAFLKDGHQPFDVLILDVDLPDKDLKVNDICSALIDEDKGVKILLTGIQPEARVIRQMMDERVCGYVLKNEVGYSLSWVISFAFDGHFIFTPGTMSLATKMNIQFPPNRLIIDGRRRIPGFTDHETEVARMAFIFSLGRRDLADELKISEQWSYGIVSELYKKMGLGEILSGEVDLFSYIGRNQIIQNRFKEIMAALGHSTKARDMETLAYHLLTMPEVLD